ncbi:MAG TPA: 30S ribosomal protein S12 methylthiotransferase RimO, partial [Acidobacteriota bacterium]|nr:30S ribosomal protein S12 methylthiotransferase RimO [Acidobacteriota bacterium]
REARFDQLGVFVYSDEEGTPARHLDGKVAARTAARRRDRLMAAQQEVLADKASAWLGRAVPVIVDGYTADADYLLQARMPQQAPEIDSVVYLTKGPLERLRPGDFANVRLKQYVGYDFTAAVIRPRRSSPS